RRVDAAAGAMVTVAGGGASGAGFSGDGGPATAAGLLFPVGVGVDDAGNVFIADTGNYRIRKVDGTTGTITTVAGTAAASIGDGRSATAVQLSVPFDVAADGGSNLLIATCSRIRKLEAATGVITTVAGGGAAGLGDGGPAIAAEVGSSGVAVDAGGDLLIADS